MGNLGDEDQLNQVSSKEGSRWIEAKIPRATTVGRAWAHRCGYTGTHGPVERAKDPALNTAQFVTVMVIDS